MITDLWPYFAGSGFIAALFFKLRGIAILAGALFAAAFAGLAISGLAGSDTWPWIFGIALMASPIIGAIALAGVLLGWLVKLVIWKATSEPTQSSDDVD
jgi:MFS family permease